jgi:hypothetical protein
MLGYRTLFSVDEDANEVLDRSIREFRRWLGSKPNRQYDGDALEFSVPERFDADAAALLLREEQPDGSRAVRATLTEVNHVGRWTTRLTAAASPGRTPWVWIDVDGPAVRPDGSGRRQWTSTPNLAKAMLSESVALDGTAELGVRPLRAFDDDVDRIIDMVCDPERRGLLFLAGSEDGIALETWIDKVSSVLRDTTGLAAGYVLDPAATRSLMAALGPTHAVSPGTIRTYRPGADPASELDGRRHRILGRDRLENDEERFLRTLLGWRAREAALEQALPKAAQRLDARMEALTNQVLVERLGGSAPVGSEIVGVPEHADNGAPTAAEPSEVQPEGQSVDDAVVREAEYLTRLAALLREATGTAVSPDDAEAALLRLATTAADVSAAQADLRDRFTDLLARAAEAETDLEVVRKQLEDEQLENAQNVQELTKALSQLDQLRVQLAALGHGEDAWSVSGDEALNDVPDSFSTLLRRLNELEHIRFTGDPELARDLESHDPLGTWTAKTWAALQAANGYAAAKADGDYSGSLDSYLQETPPGRPGFSRQRHARDESEPVKSSDRYRGARVFPVPAAIDPSGQVFMAAHFKIAQFGMISPRLHYHDATTVDGCVYVGYIGAHLPTHRTN